MDLENQLKGFNGNDCFIRKQEPSTTQLLKLSNHQLRLTTTLTSPHLLIPSRWLRLQTLILLREILNSFSLLTRGDGCLKNWVTVAEGTVDGAENRKKKVVKK